MTPLLLSVKLLLGITIRYFTRILFFEDYVIGPGALSLSLSLETDRYK
jgi:hypothetical protein